MLSYAAPALLNDIITQNAFQYKSGLLVICVSDGFVLNGLLSTITVWCLRCISCSLCKITLFWSLVCFLIFLWLSWLISWLCWSHVIKVRDMIVVIYFTLQIHIYHAYMFFYTWPSLESCRYLGIKSTVNTRTVIEREMRLIKLAQAGTLSNGALYLAQGYLGIALKVSWPLSCYQPTFLMVSGHEEVRGRAFQTS